MAEWSTQPRHHGWAQKGGGECDDGEGATPEFGADASWAWDNAQGEWQWDAAPAECPAPLQAAQYTDPCAALDTDPQAEWHNVSPERRPPERAPAVYGGPRFNSPPVAVGRPRGDGGGAERDLSWDELQALKGRSEELQRELSQTEAARTDSEARLIDDRSGLPAAATPRSTGAAHLTRHHPHARGGSGRGRRAPTTYETTRRASGSAVPEPAGFDAFLTAQHQQVMSMAGDGPPW